MKSSFIRRTLALAAVAAWSQWNGTATGQVYSGGEDFAGGREQHAVLTLQADGTCLFATETVEPRTAAEQQVRVMERYWKMSEASEEDGATAAAALSATNAAAPLTDEELAGKITATMNERAEGGGEDADQKFNVKVKNDTVLITTARSFASIEEMLRESAVIWSQAGVSFQNARFETDTNGLLRVTLTPQSGMERYLKTMRTQWKLSDTKTGLKLVFPGKVVSSGFPAMQTNATWLDLDSQKDESLDAVAKLYAAPTVITAEPGGLKLAQPLESKNLRRLSRLGGQAGEDLPITDAGPGFLAEAQSITTTALHVFPGGEEYVEENGGSLESQSGAVVDTKLFAPKGRTLLSVSGVRVLAAADDKGRSVAPDADEDEAVQTEYYSSGSSDAGSRQIQLRLQLPQPDAQSIDKLSAEAVVVTAGGWKEMALTNLQENATNELDLGAVLPGAKMVITKVSSKNSQFSLQARLQGPRAVQRLEVRAKMPGSDYFNSYSSERRFSVKGENATRNLTIQGYGIRNESASPEGAVFLVVRFPENLQREHVKFELKGLDLL